MSDKIDLDIEIFKRDIHILVRQQAVLGRFGELALQSKDLDEVLTEACHLVGQALGTDFAKIIEMQADGKTLLVRSGVGWKPGVVGVMIAQIDDGSSEAFALHSAKPLISPDVALETRFRYSQFLLDNGVKALANVPIIGSHGRQPFGLLQIDSREPRQFSERDTAFLTGYANLIAAAVDRLRSEETLRDSERQLQQAQKLEVIGRLAAGVAHDFNNILQGITSSLEIVLDESPAGTTTHEFAEIALNAANRGSTLTNHLLSYARKQTLQPTPLDIAPFMTEMQRLLSRILGKHISVMARSDLALPHIRVDPGQLQAALHNLAINSGHAMPKGGTLLLDAHMASDTNDKVIISVTDTGTGMDEATLAKAFEPFFSTKGLDGSGLGLSMVQGFIKQSDGIIRIESAPEKGTKIELVFSIDKSPSTTVEQQGAGMTLHGSGHILLVDDNADVLVTTSVFLQKAGFQVAKAASGNEALAVLAAGERFDCLVSDFAMPGMHGVDLMEQARALQPDLARLLITGFVESAGASSSPQKVAVLRKPFQRRELIEAVLRAIGQQPIPAPEDKSVSSVATPTTGLAT